MKKAQMEMMGIVLVVVFIVFALLFFLAFDIGSGKKTQEEFSKAQITKSMLNAIVNTRTRCNGLDMTTVLEDCATIPQLTCVGYVDSCDMIKQDVTQILDATFGDIYDYKWKVIRGNPASDTVQIVSYQGVDLEIQQGCVNSQDIEAANQPMPIRGGATITMMLEVCS